MFMVTIYTENRTFKNLTSAHARLLNEQDQELARYKLDGCSIKERGLFFCRLHRKEGNGRYFD